MVVGNGGWIRCVFAKKKGGEGRVTPVGKGGMGKVSLFSAQEGRKKGEEKEPSSASYEKKKKRKHHLLTWR